jgi:uncharacterized protein (TIGR03083 family)
MESETRGAEAQAAMRANTAAFEQTVRSTIALAETFTPEQWKLPTDCPGWTVQDVVSHIVGIELMLLGEDPAAGHVPAGEFPHVRNDLGRVIEPQVDARRGRAGPEVLAELKEVLDRRLAALAEVDPAEPTSRPDGRPGMIPIFESMVFRAFDCWTHEQDVRLAVGRPGNLDAPAARCTRQLMEPGLPLVVAKRAGAGKGQTVVFDVSGPVAFTSRIHVGDDGRARILPEGAEGGGAPAVTLRMGWEAFARLTAGRCGPGDVTVITEGDGELGARIVANMALTP